MKGDTPADSLTSAWSTDSLRLTAFYPKPLENPESIWQRITGIEPEEIRNQPRLKTFNEEGAWEQAKLVTASSDLRADFLYTTPAQQDEQETLLSIGTLDQARKRFQKVVETWLSLDHQAQRLAVGVVLFQPTTDRVSGYNLMSEYLPSVKIDAEGSRDFMYRINRPRQLSLGDRDVEVNRLTAWGALIRQSVFMFPLQSGVKKTSSPLHAVRVEMDINTAAEYEGTFGTEESRRIIEKLFDYADEIARTGDRP